MNIFKNIYNWFIDRTLLQKVLLIAIVGGVIYFFFFRSNDDTPTYTFATIEKSDIAETVSETGEVISSGKTELESTITGIVEEVYVENGDAVKRGDKLFAVKSTATQAEQAAAWSSYLAAKEGLASSEANQYSRQATMIQEWDDFLEIAESDDYEDPNSSFRDLPDFHVPEKTWLAAEANYKNTENDINQAKASLNKAWLDYQATVDGDVVATADGVITNLAISKNQQIDNSTTAMVIKSTGQTWVQVAINENEISKVEVGQTANISLDAVRDKTFPAMVKRVDEFGTLVSDVVIFYVYLELIESENAVKPSMTAQVDINTNQANDVLVVPNTAIKPYQGDRAVEILNKESNTTLFQPISTGISDGTITEIISGVEEGQEIITGTIGGDNEGGGLFARPD